MDNKFKRSERNAYSNEEKLALGELVAKFKDKFDAEVKKNEGKTKFDAKRKIHLAIKPSTGFIAKSARHFYSDLPNVSNDDPDFERATKLDHAVIMICKDCKTFLLVCLRSQGELVLDVERIVERTFASAIV